MLTPASWASWPMVRASTTYQGRGRTSVQGQEWQCKGMISGSHAIIYAEDAEKTRAFFRDVLGFPFVDAHDGWLIFKLPPAELGIHPTGSGMGGEGDGTNSGPQSGHHELYLMCDDVVATVAELKAKGVEFTSPIENQGF